jgi:hypothetical protein
MAEEERKILIDVEVVGNEEEIGRINTELRQNRDQIKELSKDYETNATEIAKLEVANKKLSTSKNVLVNQTKAEGNSLDALRARLASLTKERNSLDTSIEGNAKRFAELQREIKSTSDQVKGFEEQGGDFRRNVGNYSSALAGATQGTGAFGNAFGAANKVLLANPLLLIVGLFAKLSSSVAAAQGVVDKFNMVIQPFNTAFQRLIGLLQEFNFSEFFKDPLGYVKQMGSELSVAAEQGRELVRLNIELEEQVIKNTTKEKERRLEYEKQITTSKDLTKSSEERAEAARKAEQLLNDIEREQDSILQKRLRIAQINAAQNDTDRKAAQELANIEAEILNIKIEREKKQREINAATKAEADEAKKASEERIKLLKAEEKERHKLLQDRVKREKNAILDIQQFVLEQQLKEAKKDEDRVRAFIELEEFKAARLLANTELTEMERQLIMIQSEQRIQDEITKIQKTAQANREKELMAGMKKAVAIKAAESKASGDKAKKEMMDEQELQAFKINAATMTVGAIANLMKEGSQAQKIAAKASIIADSAAAAIGIFKSSTSLPEPAATANRVIQLGALAAATVRSLSQVNSASASGIQSIGAGAGTTGASRTQSLGIVQPQLLQQFSQPIQNQVGLESASGRVNLPPIYVNVTDINKVNAGVRAKVTESRL